MLPAVPCEGPSLTLRSAVAHDGRPASCGDAAALVAGALVAALAGGGELTLTDPGVAGGVEDELEQAAVSRAAPPRTITTAMRLILL
jgi:hypothetical protein